MRVVVTGAAGYVGSVLCEQLVDAGVEVVAVDNLSRGHQFAVPAKADFVHGDVSNSSWIRQLLSDAKPQAVLDLASVSMTPEPSVSDPGRFFRANVVGGLNLLDAMVAANVPSIVFASSATIYGDAEQTPVPETAPPAPVNPYAESKLMFERMLGWYRRAHGINYVSLRFFNACGATADRGELHVPETHLVSILLEAALGLRDEVPLYGEDYDTPDGTCIRDYVHVADVARAHTLALENVERIGGAVYNLSIGRGYSNREVIDTIQKVSGRPIKVVTAERRPGDPARLVADASKIRAELGWEPQVTTLEEMARSAWAWREAHPHGYPMRRGG